MIQYFEQENHPGWKRSTSSLLSGHLLILLMGPLGVHWESTGRWDPALALSRFFFRTTSRNTATVRPDQTATCAFLVLGWSGMHISDAVHADSYQGWSMMILGWSRYIGNFLSHLTHLTATSDSHIWVSNSPAAKVSRSMGDLWHAMVQRTKGYWHHVTHQPHQGCPLIFNIGIFWDENFAWPAKPCAPRSTWDVSSCFEPKGPMGTLNWTFLKPIFFINGPKLWCLGSMMVYDSAQYPMFCQIGRRKDTRLLSIALPRVPHVATPGEQKRVPTLTSEHLKSSNILPFYMSDLKTLKCMVGCCAMIVLHILYI